jgi:glycosyltransferase involved in cell wall biosynthesis
MKEKVIFTGRAPDADLPAIYSGALAAVFPSLHEGFGLTPLEALACGIPLITHRAGAVQEAVGDAAIILERLSVDDLAQAIIRVVQDVDLRQELRRCGIERAAKYQREKNARETIALYQEVAHENTR